MKILKENLLKYLPIIIGLFVLFITTDAFAVPEWMERAAANILGIDTGDNCTPPQAHSSCRFCPLFKVLYNAGSYVAGKAYATFSSDLGKLIITFLAVSLAIIVLKNVASMNTKDPGTLLNDICRKVFVVIAIFIIVTSDYYNLMNITLIPVIKTGLELTNIDGSLVPCAAAADGITGFTSSAGATAEAGLPRDVGEMIICSAEHIESKINLLFETGRWGVCLGLGPDRLWHIIPHPIYLIDSLFLYLGGIFFLVGYPWVLGDAILQLGIAMSLLPFAVAGYAFEGTKSYLGKVFSWVLHSIFTFVLMAVLILCIMEYIENLLGSAMTAADRKVLFTSPTSGIAFYGPNMIMLLFVLVIGWSYMPSTKELADKFSQGAGLSAAGKIGTQLAEQMEKQTGKVAAKAGKVAASAASHAVRAGSRQGIMGLTKYFGKTDADGNKTLSFGGLKFTTMKNADGSSVLKREYTSITGRKHVMLSDKYSTLKQEYDANGNLIKNEVKFKQEFADKYLFNKDGTMNVGAMQALLDSPLAKNNPAYKQAIMEQIAINAIKAKGHKFSVDKYYRSREVVFDPNNPNQILVKQKDYNGNETTFSMNVNMDTGQVAINATKKEKRLLPGKKDGFTEQYTSIFDNGVVSFNTTGRYNPLTGETSQEKTSFRYSQAAQTGHAHFLAKSDKNQIIDSHGNISQRLLGDDNPLNLLFGMDGVHGLRQHNDGSFRVLFPNSSDPNNPIAKTVDVNSYVGQDFLARQNGTWREDGSHLMPFLATQRGISNNQAFMETLAEVDVANRRSAENAALLRQITGKDINDPDFADAASTAFSDNYENLALLHQIQPGLNPHDPELIDKLKAAADVEGNFSRILAAKTGLSVDDPTIVGLNNEYRNLQDLSRSLSANGGQFAQFAATTLGRSANDPVVEQFLNNFDFDTDRRKLGTDETTTFLDILTRGHVDKTNVFSTNNAQNFIFGSFMSEYGYSTSIDDIFGTDSQSTPDNTEDTSSTSSENRPDDRQQDSSSSRENRQEDDSSRREENENRPQDPSPQDSSTQTQDSNNSADRNSNTNRENADTRELPQSILDNIQNIESIISQANLSNEIIEAQKEAIRGIIRGYPDMPAAIKARLEALLNR